MATWAPQVPGNPEYLGTPRFPEYPKHLGSLEHPESLGTILLLGNPVYSGLPGHPKYLGPRELQHPASWVLWAPQVLQYPILPWATQELGQPYGVHTPRPPPQPTFLAISSASCLFSVALL